MAELEVPSTCWDDLDTVLLEAAVVIAKGPLARELYIYRDEEPGVGQALSGRAALWHLYQRFELDRGVALSIDLQTLVQLHFNADLKGFLANWDCCLMALSSQPADALLLVFLDA